MLRSRRRFVIAAFAVLVVAGAIPFLRKSTSELPVYTLAAERMCRGETIYRPDEPKPFTYPAFFALPFVPLCVLPEVLWRPLWYLANVAILVLLAFLLWGVLAPSLPEPRAPPARFFVIAVALLAARHVSAVFENQSHDLLVLLAVVLGVVALGRGRETRGGAWLGAGAACKATPLLFAPVLLLQGRWRAAVTSMVAAVLLVLLPDLVFPQASGELWVVSWWHGFVGKLEVGQAPEAEGAWSRWNILNQNLAGTIYRLSRAPGRTDAAHFDVSLWTPSTELLRWTTWAATALVLAFVGFVTRWGHARDRAAAEQAFRRLGEASAVVAAMLLLSPMSSKSHFCLLLLPITYCTADYLYRKRDRVTGALLVLVFVTGTLSVKGIIGRRLGNELLARGSVTWCTLLCLLATGHVLFHRDRPAARFETSRERAP